MHVNCVMIFLISDVHLWVTAFNVNWSLPFNRWQLQLSEAHLSANVLISSFSFLDFDPVQYFAFSQL